AGVTLSGSAHLDTAMRSNVLGSVILGPSHRPTGRTRHLLGATEIPAPHHLKIMQYEPDSGYYLLYCDDTGSEMADTYHETIESAVSQARWEFNVQTNEWRMMD